MKIIVLGAGIIGISTAWHLRERGHEVTVSYCEPWANAEAPLKVLKWMTKPDAPLLFRPQWPVGEGLQQWLWGLRFLGQCNDAAFERNVSQLVALGAYSHAALKDIVNATGIEYHRLERGIAHYYTDAASFDTAGAAAELMRRHGVSRRVVSRDELLKIEPAFKPFAHRIVGGTFTDTDESGDARLFTQGLARLCEQRGVEFLYGHAVQQLDVSNNRARSVRVAPVDEAARTRGPASDLKADAIVVATGSYTAPMLRQVGVRLPIYPGKGYSATFKILKPEAAPWVSAIDDELKVAMSRLGDELRVAGTIEVGGYDLDLNGPVARARCAMLARRIETVMPGVCDTRLEHEGGQTNFPFIGQTRIPGLWVNAGHGTLGWTHGAGSGKALAELINGEVPRIADRFGFLGSAAPRAPKPALA